MGSVNKNSVSVRLVDRKESELRNGTTYTGNCCSKVYSEPDYDSISSVHITPTTFDDTNDESTRSDVTDDESLMVDDPSSLCHTLEYIMCVPEICDVIFLVGKKQMPIYGLKAVLSARSSVLYKMLQKCQRKVEQDLVKGRSKNKMSRFLPFRNKHTNYPKTTPGHPIKPHKITVPLSNYDVVVFRKFNTFLHLGHVTLTQDTLIGLLCAASEFVVEDLQDACWEFLKKCASSGVLTSILHSARRYRFHSHYFGIQAKIQKMSFEPEATT